MAKSKTRKGFWILSAIFAAFSGAVALGWLYETDLWTLRAAQEYRWSFLDSALSLLSLSGSIEVSGIAMLMLLTGLLLNSQRELAGRILVAFTLTGFLELAMKLYLPQTPIPEEAALSGDYAPLVAIIHPYPYPSGHVLRSVIIFGALYLLSRNRLLRAGLLAVLLGVVVGRIYTGVHWASDVVGGALLGLAALLWAFSKEETRWRLR